MLSVDRRFGARYPLEMYLNAYVSDRQQKGFTLNISESGLYLNTVKKEPLENGTPVGLEFTLPGTQEVIWAAGTICHDLADDYFLGHGVRFTAMAGLHNRLVREYCHELRKRRWRRSFSS